MLAARDRYRNRVGDYIRVWRSEPRSHSALRPVSPSLYDPAHG
jgi:hypothetical protein